MWLIIGDLHFTDNARDAHRFGIFDWIKKQQQKYDVAATFLAGDITDAKDRHSSTLVNKIVAGLTGLKPPVYVDRGNHDYRDPDNPFFNFLNHISGLEFVTEPKLISHGRHMGVIPHYREQAEFDAAVAKIGNNADAFLVHQTFDGAIAETGVRLTGLSASLMAQFKLPLGVYAGDVHMPQTQPPVRYIGCPYHVRFGDDFTPRSLLIKESGAIKNLYFEAPYKWSLRIRDAVDIENNERLNNGDQVKLVVELAREEAVDWKQIKADVLKACKRLELEVHGVKLEVTGAKEQVQRRLVPTVSKPEILQQFSAAEKLSSAIRKAGQKLLGE